MPTIELKSKIYSDIHICFDLARNIDVHKESLKHTKSMPIAGKTTGLIEKGEWVSWEAIHFGFVQHLTSKVVELERPHFFVGEMVLGIFKSYRHEHFFEEIEGGTMMTDKFAFESPYGALGRFVNWLFLNRYLTNLLKERNRFIKSVAESEKAKELSVNFVKAHQ